ncbi:mannose-1-phosphate guanylyltransferase/mannose-6-phosphate isomerase [Halotalea alkalilenta]|uniref:mannose-1-phosphate guanylyltransferase/mannose-6-phosphate isomerase n=1 Tax=Halotalea alkalilenta TaxID=376489 RepID=UPI0004865611|nr:mannose-1-phosphate guanylyltransferase/mannose-6-phosphate isomerase [Halotalea alkalilenta]
MNSEAVITPVVMAGGSGTRLWPLSRRLRPKQFLDLLGEGTLLQQTLARLEGLPCTAPIVICNEEHRFLVAEQLRASEIGDTCLLLEPEGRNTAPAIALGALQAERAGAAESALLLVLAADHVIQDVEAFQAAVRRAVPLAAQGHLVTFGIVPSRAETGYGYIQRGKALDAGFAVQRFVEKPDAQTAARYLESGEYLWNSGMFLMRADRYLGALGQYAPDMLAACEAAIEGAAADLDFIRVDAEAFSRCPSDSIDYAVMEKDPRVAVVPLQAGWSDIGSWSSLWEISDKDQDGNVLTGDVIADTTHNTLVHSSHRLVATVGVEDLVVVETKDAVLITRKDQDQRVKLVVEQLKREGRCEHDNHREVYRPWGKYDSIDMEARYQVKRITVNPGQKLSVQMHHHRSEHWVVVSGTALVGIDGEEKLVAENESVYIPLGATHYMSNPGKIPLELIEVQSGAYLGEDDIVRFEDLYGRSR